MNPSDANLAYVARCLREAGFSIRDAPHFAAVGIAAHTAPIDAEPDLRVIDGIVFIYPRGDSIELRVTQHGGPHWLNTAANEGQAIAIAKAFLAHPAMPPGQGWTKA